MVGKHLHRAKELTLDILFIVAGAILYAIGINGFTAPNNIAPGGVSGVATLLNYAFGTPIGTLMFLINVPIMIAAVVVIGYKLVAKTMMTIVISSIVIDVIAPFVPVYHGDPLIITLIGGACQGVGLSLVFMRGGTTGGTDMIARVLNHRMRHLSMGRLLLVLDGCVVVASVFVYKSLESAVYACVVIFVCSQIVDMILYGMDAGNGKMFFVFSKENERIAEQILTDVNRGATFIRSRGAYLKQEGEMLFCAVRRYEVHRVSEVIRNTDPDAFVIVGDAGEITGAGFKPARSDDRTLKEILGHLRNKNGDLPEDTEK